MHVILYISKGIVSLEIENSLLQPTVRMTIVYLYDINGTDGSYDALKVIYILTLCKCNRQIVTDILNSKLK